MEQKLRFGLVLGRLAILIKNIWTDYEQLLRSVFSCFRDKENIKITFLKKFPEPLLRLPRSLRSNDLETQNDKNYK